MVIRSAIKWQVGETVTVQETIKEKTTLEPALGVVPEQGSVPLKMVHRAFPLAKGGLFGQHDVDSEDRRA
jgi:hypothetical protein